MNLLREPFTSVNVGYILIQFSIDDCNFFRSIIVKFKYLEDSLSELKNNFISFVGSSENKKFIYKYLGTLEFRLKYNQNRHLLRV